MSIWDTCQNQKNEDESPKDGEYFVIQYGTEKRKVPCSSGMTLEKALEENASRLGFSPGRQVTWRDSNGVVAASIVGQTNERYVASVSLETKGTF